MPERTTTTSLPHCRRRRQHPRRRNEGERQCVRKKYPSPVKEHNQAAHHREESSHKTSTRILPPKYSLSLRTREIIAHQDSGNRHHDGEAYTHNQPRHDYLFKRCAEECDYSASRITEKS